MGLDHAEHERVLAWWRQPPRISRKKTLPLERNPLEKRCSPSLPDHVPEPKIPGKDRAPKKKAPKNVKPAFKNAKKIQWAAQVDHRENQGPKNGSGPRKKRVNQHQVKTPCYPSGPQIIRPGKLF